MVGDHTIASGTIDPSIASLTAGAVGPPRPHTGLVPAVTGGLPASDHWIPAGEHPRTLPQPWRCCYRGVSADCIPGAGAWGKPPTCPCGPAGRECTGLSRHCDRCPARAYTAGVHTAGERIRQRDGAQPPLSGCVRPG